VTDIETSTDAADEFAATAADSAQDDAQDDELQDDELQDDAEQPRSGRNSGDNGLLVREGDIAADYLERLLDIVDYDGDIDLDVENDRAVVAIVGSDLKPLIGTRGEVLDALQELTRLAVQQQTGVRSRLMLDVSGHRAQRRKELAPLSDPVRLRLLSLLATAEGGAVCACDLVEPVGKSQPTVSHHLRILREAGLVTSEKRGTNVWYAAVPAALESLREALGPRT